MTRATFPQVYRAINRVSAEIALAGIPKLHANLQDQYLYRSIDDVLGRLAPLLAKNGLCIFPQVLRRQCTGIEAADLSPQFSVRLLIQYEIVCCRDGSKHRVRVWGEALDSGDKGTAKAMSAAYKSAMLQLFCIPVAGEDSDSRSIKLRVPLALPEPAQGWDQWSADVEEMIRSCETPAALDRIRSARARELASLQKSRPQLYDQLGKSFAVHCAALSETRRVVLKRKVRSKVPVDA